MKKYIFIVIIAALLFITIIASHSNRNNYYVKYKDGAVEVSKGRFSPLGKELFISMPGAQPPSPEKKVYSREEIFPYITRYYIDKADQVLEEPGLPDFDIIRNYLNKSLSYAITDDLQNEASVRLNRIERMVLLYKADIAASKDSVAELKTALEFLKRSSTLGPDTIESELIKQKIESVRKRITAIETTHAEGPVQDKPVK
jgi:colicin import membrane protein